MKKLVGWGIGWTLWSWAMVPAWSAPTSEEAPVASISAEALAYWTHDDGGAWLVPILLEELGDDIRRLEVPPEQAVAAAARHFSLDSQQAAALVEAEVRTAAWLDPQYRADFDPEELLGFVEDAVSAIGEPVDRWHLLIRFYGALATERDERESLYRERAALLLGEVFESGRIEEVWDQVELERLADVVTLHHLLGRAPGSPWLLRKLADSSWDPLERASIRLHLMGRDEATADEALRDLLNAGAVRSAVELWQSLAVPPSLADESVSGSAMAAALWLDGYGDEAEELLRAVPTVEVGEPPDRTSYSDGDRAFYDETESWSERSGKALRRQLVSEALLPSDIEPYELGLALLNSRAPLHTGDVLPDALWPQVAASWGQAVGHDALERYFAIHAMGDLASQPTDRVQTRMLHWAEALKEGWISPAVYELRERLYRETLGYRDAAAARVEALADASAGYFPPHEAVGVEFGPFGQRELERVVSPFTVRRLGPAAAREWLQRETESDVAAQATLDSGLLPPTLPADSEQVVAFGEDGADRWVLHQGVPTEAFTAWVSPWVAKAYWLSLSRDGGHSWAPALHTGLLSGSLLQVVENGVALERGELTLVGQPARWMSHGRVSVSSDDDGPILFELRVDLDDLRRDDDGDGWTDVFERGLFTEAGSTDSDGDGLDDPQDPLPLQFGATGLESEALAAALVHLFGLDLDLDLDLNQRQGQARTGAVKNGARDPWAIRLFGPELPLPELDGQTIVRLPEDRATDDRVGGRFDTRIRLWMMNREATRAFLSWTGSRYGGVEYIRSPQGWIQYAGYEGGGCVVTEIEPSVEAQQAAEGL